MGLFGNDGIKISGRTLRGIRGGLLGLLGGVVAWAANDPTGQATFNLLAGNHPWLVPVASLLGFLGGVATPTRPDAER